jgi:hypothetical protein
MYYILLSFLLISCNLQEKQITLANTKWEYKVSEGCISYITFKADSTYEDYDCERDYPNHGKYEFRSDTVFLIAIDLSSDLPGKNKKIVKGRSKYIFKKESLKYICWEDFVNGKWSNITLPQNEILYMKRNK